MTVTDLRHQAYAHWQRLRRDRSVLRAARWLSGAKALELGGPSAVFGANGLMPVYSQLAELDMVDFAEHTLWSDTQSSETLPSGKRIIGEAANLSTIASGGYDAVLASHVIEHVANPLGALDEWKRVIKPDGLVVLVVPHRDGTFDHQRPLTTLDHLGEDQALGRGEDDLTHLEEILALHDLSRDPGAPDRETFVERCHANATTRGMHHHVFATRSVAELCRAADLELLHLKALLPFHVVAVCRSSTNDTRDTSRLVLAKALDASPFSSDSHTR
jgi:SAM-dependent methyltransferase